MTGKARPPSKSMSPSAAGASNTPQPDQPEGKGGQGNKGRAKAKAKDKDKDKVRVRTRAKSKKTKAELSKARAKAGAIGAAAKPNTPTPGDGNPGGVAISRAEYAYRSKVVEEAMIEGKRGDALIEALAMRGRKCGWSTVRGYMATVRRKWEAEDAEMRPIARERQLRDLYQKVEALWKRGEFQTWLGAVRLIMDIEGTRAPKEVDLRQRIEFAGWTEAELDEFIASDGRQVPARFAIGAGAAGPAGDREDGTGSLWDQAAKRAGLGDGGDGGEG